MKLHKYRVPVSKDDLEEHGLLLGNDFKYYKNGYLYGSLLAFGNQYAMVGDAFEVTDDYINLDYLWEIDDISKVEDMEE